MFTCDVTKAGSFARYFVRRELLLIFTHVTFPIGSMGKNENVVLESKIILSKAKLFRF